MKFKYDGTTYVGSREQIIRELKNDLENKSLTFSKLESALYFGEEKYILSKGTEFNVDAIRRVFINKVLNKVPENSFHYNDKTYFGDKEKILKEIEADLRKDFRYTGGTYFVGEETHVHVHNIYLNLVLLHEEMIAQALKRIENEICI